MGHILAGQSDMAVPAGASWNTGFHLFTRQVPMMPPGQLMINGVGAYFLLILETGTAM